MEKKHKKIRNLQRFDLKRNDCAKCKPGGVQCGAPMEKVDNQHDSVFLYLFANCVYRICFLKLHMYFTMPSQWCQSKKSKTGCPGIPQFKYTRSSTGFPCYWDPKRWPYQLSPGSSSQA